MTTGTDTTKAQQEGNSVAETQCAGTIPIIPVRYAIVPRKDDSQPEYLYANKDCGARLEQGFEKLRRSIYTDLSPEIQSMTKMRFPVILTKRRSPNEETIQ